MNNIQTTLSTIDEENESELSTLNTTQTGNYEEASDDLPTNEIENDSKTSMSMQSKTYTIDSNASSFQCFKEIIMSSSSLFLNPFYYFPVLEDPGIQDAFRIAGEEPLNDNGCQVYKDMCKHLEIYPISKVCKSLNTQQLNLKYYVPCDNQMRAICKTLESNTCIEELNLQDNWLSIQSCAYLASVLQRNTTLKILKMKECRIGAEGMAVLSEALEMSSIQELDLSFNSLKDEGLKEGKTALSVNVNLNKLNLSHNEFTEEAVLDLYEILVEAYSLLELDLSWNCFNSPICMKKLCQGLVESTSLQRLNLAWNGIASEQTVFPFIRYLKKSVTLKFLDLSNNLISGHSLDIIMKGVAESRSLEHLKIGNNVFSPIKAYKCAEILARFRNKPLKLIDMENMVVQKKFLNLMELIRQRGKNVIYGAVLADYEIHGPYLPKVLFGRCKFLGMKSKKKKNRIDFGHFVLSLPDQPISPEEFQAALTARKLNTHLDSNLIAAVQDHYMISKKRKIDCSQLVNDYMLLYPGTQPEPPKKKKPLKENKSSKKKNTGKTDASKGTSDQKGVPQKNRKIVLTKEKTFSSVSLRKDKIISSLEKSVNPLASSTKITERKTSLKRSSMNLKKKHQVSYGNLEEKPLKSDNIGSEEAEINALNASGVFFLESSENS